MKKIVTVAIILILSATYSLCNAELTIEERDRWTVAGNAMVEYWLAIHEEMSKYHTPHYTFDNSILDGVAFVHDTDEGGNFSVIFVIENNTKSAINLKKCSYNVIKNDGSIYRLENPIIQDNTGVAGSYTLNASQRAEVYLTSPFKNFVDLDNMKETYIKLGDKRIFFVPEEKFDEYKKIENRIIRHLRNLWWNIK